MTENHKIKWKRLENVSKIFPATANNKDTKVFRLSCELKEEVDPIYLQEALDITRESFPIFNSVLKRGVFWYYFESRNIRPLVTEESQPLYAPIYLKDSKSLLYRVFYYKKRISVEMFHALTDGAGVSWFMETLVYHYLSLKYKNDLLDDMPQIQHRASISQKMKDSFEKNYRRNRNKKKNKSKLNGKKIKRAYVIKGSRNLENRTRLIEGTMSVKEMLTLSRKYETTLTIFLTALLMYSIYKEMPSNLIHRPVVLSVPINLRQFFESNTARNFFSTMEIEYNFEKQSSQLEDIIDYLAKTFKENLSEDNVDIYLERFMVIEKNPLARVVPLVLKDLALKAANVVNYMSITSSISNIGQIKMDEKFEPYIEKFIVSVSARRPQVTLCSYKDNLVISFMSPFEDTDIQSNFFQTLSNEGINITIASNL